MWKTWRIIKQKKEYIDEDDESKFVFNASAFNERRHKINTEDAVEMTLQLRNRLIQEPTGTRAIDDVANVYPLGFSKLITRASESSQMLDTMAYIVEFSNDGGFAIVASDNRMANPILALVEHGCYDDCMDNEGLDLFLEQAEEYILQNAELFEFYKDSVIFDTTIFDKNEMATRATYRGTYTLDHGYVDSYGPLLRTAWRQGSPYNQECPVKCTSEEPKTGCVPLAFAQVMTYWKFPSVISGIYMDWNLMLDNGTKTHKDKYISSSTKMISKLCGLLGEKFKTEYKCGSASTDTKDAWKKVASFGYKSDWDDYSYNYVKKHLAAGRPVVTRARKSGYTDGHAWVIDGCKRWYQQKMSYVISGDKISETPIAEFSVYYLHHNWGWGGKGNGYFQANIFNPTKPSFLDDPSLTSTKNYDYIRNINCFVVWK